MSVPFLVKGKQYKLSELAVLAKGQAPKQVAKENQQYRLCLQYEYIGSSEQGKKLLEKVGVVTMMKYIFGGAAVSGIIVSSVAGWDAPMFAEAWKGEWHWTAWAVLAFILIFPTYLSYFLVPVGLKYLKTTVVAIYSYLILVVTTVVSLSLGQDRFSWTQAVAIAMICISVYFVEVAEGNSKKPDTPLPPQS